MKSERLEIENKRGRGNRRTVGGDRTEREQWKGERRQMKRTEEADRKIIRMGGRPGELDRRCRTRKRRVGHKKENQNRRG